MNVPIHCIPKSGEGNHRESRGALTQQYTSFLGAGSSVLSLLLLAHLPGLLPPEKTVDCQCQMELNKTFRCRSLLCHSGGGPTQNHLPESERRHVGWEGSLLEVHAPIIAARAGP